MHDWELLQSYADDGQEDAFAELLHRHVALVYSTALRQVNNPTVAEEVAQKVFCLLARKAAALSHHTLLIGWLYRTTNLIAAERSARTKPSKCKSKM
jgi:DNA-directed RNA polymerase specialized sigma24 family protein